LLLLAIREYALPLLRFRKHNKKTERLTLFRNNDIYKSSLTYHKDLLRGTGIGLLALPIFVIAAVAGNMGEAAGTITTPRNYIVIDSSPKQIVLIDYGSKWLTAQYDDSYPGMPAYRKEYTIIQAADMGKDPFTIKHINELYVYN
jgi:hypothetical protein